jgi:hypothetical protein
LKAAFAHAITTQHRPFETVGFEVSRDRLSAAMVGGLIGVHVKKQESISASGRGNQRLDRFRQYHGHVLQDATTAAKVPEASLSRENCFGGLILASGFHGG